MRILHLGKFYPPHRGGMESFLEQLTLAQAAGGDEVLVLAHGEDAPRLAAPRQRLEIRRAPVLCTLGGYAPVAPGLPFLFVQALRRFRPDVVHVHAPNGAALWAALFCGRIPLVLHWHADVQFPPENSPSPLLMACWRRLEALVLRRSALVVATSQSYLDASPALAPHRYKCRVVPLGLAEQDTARVSESSPEAHPALDFLDRAEGLRVLAVGRLAHYKGFSHLCQAVLQTPEASLCLVGEGEERPALEALARQAQGRIHLAGAVDDHALDACYRRSQVLCLPSISRSEAFGVVLLEAMRRGLPCIASRVPGSGMAEVLEHETTGLLVAPGSARELAEALRKLAEEPELRQRLGQAGRERFLKHYAMGKVVRSIRAAYAEAVTTKNKP